MFNGLSNAHLYTASRIGVNVTLRDGTQVNNTGTAFFVQNRNKEVCLVTNRHVLDPGYSEPSGKFRGASLTGVWVESFLAQGGDSSKRPNQRLVVDVQLALSPIKFAADYHEDVAAFIGPKILTRSGGTASVDFYVEASYLADDVWIEENLSVCDFVAFPGFPTWHDKLEGRPILRTGTIASDPRSNYSDVPEPRGRRIAYEAFSFGGSSGSPVFATEKGFRGGGGLVVTGHREGRLVGINAGHLQGPQGVHSGVSYFIKSSSVLDLIHGDRSLTNT